MTREPAAIQPPVAYLPCKLDDEGDVDEILMVQMADGTVALMGYTALDRFMVCCGDAHPWVPDGRPCGSEGGEAVRRGLP